MKKVISVLLMLLLFAEASFAGIPSDKGMYVGGTVTTVPEKSEGKVTLTDSAFVLECKKDQISIPYERVTSLEYGQKAGRRVGATIGMAVAVGIFAAPMLFSKKRKHYLTIGFDDENKKPQAVVIELGKDIVKPTLSGMEAKTGKKIEYQDDEARKSAGVPQEKK